MTPVIGVLAVQGGYQAHEKTLAGLGVRSKPIRKPGELDTIDGLIMPGGESTTMLKFLGQGDFFSWLKDFASARPVFGTCAGLILLAKDVSNPAQISLGLLDIAVERNAYGRQNDSAIIDGETCLAGGKLEMVFIRAPRIARLGKAVETLAWRGGDPVLVREGHLLGATFHPELGSDARVHEYFLTMVADHKGSMQLRRIVSSAV